MKLYVEKEYASYGEKYAEATDNQIRENKIVQRLLQEAYRKGLEKQAENNEVNRRWEESLKHTQMGDL